MDGRTKRPLSALDEVELVESKVRIEIVDVRNTGLSNPDGPDRRGVDQSDARVPLGKELGQAGRGAPAGRAAADDNDGRNGFVRHGAIGGIKERQYKYSLPNAKVLKAAARDTALSKPGFEAPCRREKV